MTTVLHPDQFADAQPIYVGRPDDDVEMVPLEAIQQVRPGNDTQWGVKGGESPEALASDIRTNGWAEPVVVQYLHDPSGVSHRAVVGEGNHRIEAAAAGGISHVPVRVVRTSLGREEMSSVPGYQEGGHVPAEMRPSQVGLK